VRILTVADVYDALTADRVYREAWPAERALALLEEETGSAFDPECVAALRDVVVAEDPRLAGSVAVIARAPGATPGATPPGPHLRRRRRLVSRFGNS
jgi:hypothetical protein